MPEWDGQSDEERKLPAARELGLCVAGDLPVTVRQEEGHNTNNTAAEYNIAKYICTELKL